MSIITGPTLTQQGAFTVGRDVELVIITPAGIVQTTPVTGFYVRQATFQLRQKGMDGIVKYSTLPEGWFGHWYYDRGDSVIDDLFTALEAEFYATGIVTNIYLDVRITNPDGSVSRTRYEGVAIELDEAGHFNGDDIVQLKVAFKASRRVRVN